MEYDNLQLSSDFTEQQYATQDIPFQNQDTGLPGGGAITTLNGDAGAGTAGPVISLTGGSTGWEFTAVGASVTMTLNDADVVRTSLGIALNNVTNVDPLVTDDSGAGYSQFSMWINTAVSSIYMCIDASIGAAVWVQIS